MEFVWDPKKAVENYRKHGVSFSEAATVFGDRHLLVAHADSGRMTRMISARQSDAKGTKGL